MINGSLRIDPTVPFKSISFLYFFFAGQIQFLFVTVFFNTYFFFASDFTKNEKHKK